MNIDERRDLIETLVHDYGFDNSVEDIKDYRSTLYNLGAADLLNLYESWYNGKTKANRSTNSRRSRSSS